MKRALITGITGQDGAYLAGFLLDEGFEVLGTVRHDLPEPMHRLEAVINLDSVKFIEINYMSDDIISVIEDIKPDEIYNFASQSSVGNSVNIPEITYELNNIFVYKLLEGVRTKSPKSRVFQASSSEIFGYPEKLPLTEKMPLRPINVYGASKAAAHILCGTYRDVYGLYVSCGILFNHESVLRDDNFVVKKIVSQAVKVSLGQEQKLVVGNTSVRRDFGYAPDYVKGMMLALRAAKADDYIFCSGKSVSIEEIIDFVFNKLNLSKDKVEQSKEFFRTVDIEESYGSNQKAKRELGWNYDKDFTDVLEEMIEFELS